ncbi:unannotated protein [freshwater metagenome]|uniref:Unannotated protein n=1 Tax=freshwater metagenome TaxID=449393 RepID=A0A6J6NVI2_9ZZZZ
MSASAVSLLVLGVWVGCLGLILVVLLVADWWLHRQRWHHERW